MEIKIQAIHFDATSALKQFIEKKVSKLETFYDGIIDANVVLKVVKPETVKNKEAEIKLKIAGKDLFVSKTSDTFEESVDNAVDALKNKLIKEKEKKIK